MTNSICLADIARNLSTSTLSRNQLKVIRARLRRANLTNLSGRMHGEYHIDATVDYATDVRTVGGTTIVQAIAMQVA